MMWLLVNYKVLPIIRVTLLDRFRRLLNSNLDNILFLTMLVTHVSA